MRSIVLALLLPCSALAAAPTLVAHSSTGASVELFTEAGPCVGGALSAQWVAPDAVRRVPGCWRLAGSAVEIAFLDGDAIKIPAGAFKTPAVL
jgi:hypothetical protein